MSARNKILKPEGQSPSSLEVLIAQALVDLESNSPELKADLRPLQFVAAREVNLDIFLRFFGSKFVDIRLNWVMAAKPSLSLYRSPR